VGKIISSLAAGPRLSDNNFCACGVAGWSCGTRTCWTSLRTLIKAAGARLWYLPPYSPDLNPIEQTFAKIKHWMRSARSAPSTTFAAISAASPQRVFLL
jgi:hypothetical protein